MDFSKKQPKRSQRVRVLFAITWISVLWTTGVTASPEDSVADQAIPSTDDLHVLIEDLSHDSYFKREAAQRRLVAAGTLAVPVLLDALQKGDLESIERAMSALIEIGVKCTPNKDGEAWDRLTHLSKVTSGRTASAARKVLDEVGDFRAAQAREWLQRAGVFIGQRELLIGAVSSSRQIVQIDKDWNGDVDVLQWLKWLRGVRNARVMGKGLTQEVLEEVFTMPKLRSVALVDGTLEETALDGIRRQQTLDSLDIRYVKLSDHQIDQIAATPLRESLTLMGTGVSNARVKAISEATPGLKIEHRMGGFLGVRCSSGVQPCSIDGVVPGSAAEAAGLIQGDIITQVDQVVVRAFEDLQATINEHVPGDELTVKFRRATVTKTVKLKLRRYVEMNEDPRDQRALPGRRGILPGGRMIPLPQRPLPPIPMPNRNR